MLVSFLVVSYNTKDYTLACLDSLKQLQSTLPDGESEIIVVDNASVDGSVAAIQASFPEVHLHCNQQNSGFGAANNLAMRLAQGEYFGLVNSDAAYVGGSLQELLQLFQNPVVVLVGPKVVYPSGKIQTSNNAFPNLWTEFLRITHIAHFLRNQKLRATLASLTQNPLIGRVVGNSIREYLRVYQQAELTREVDWVAASVVFAPRWIVEKGFLFNEEYRMYYEDTDWCRRLRKAGYHIWYSPSLTFSHWADERPGKNYNQFADYERQASKLRYFRTHANLLERIGLRILLLSHTSLRWLLAGKTTRQNERRILTMLVQQPL